MLLSLVLAIRFSVNVRRGDGLDGRQPLHNMLSQEHPCLRAMSGVGAPQVAIRNAEIACRTYAAFSRIGMTRHARPQRRFGRPRLRADPGAYQIDL